LTKPHSRTTAIWINQFHPRRLKSPLDDVKGCPPGQSLRCLEQPDCYDPYTGAIGQLMLCPIEKTARGTALGGRKHTVINTPF
jgi:hypothetical protein